MLVQSSTPRYDALANEFSQALDRPLSNKEKAFIIWLVTQERKEKHDGFPDLGTISTSY